MADDDNKEGSQPVNLTPEQLTNLINSAITSHLKRLPDYGKLIEEKLAAFQPKASDPAPDAPKGKDTGKSDPQITALLAKMEEQSKALTAAQERAVQAERQQREDRARAELRQALTGKVRPEAVDDVADLLFSVRKQVEINEQGEAFLKVKRAPVPGFPEEEALMPIADGVEHWAKSKAASIYIPATQSGTTSTPARASKMPTPNERSSQSPKWDGPAKTDAEKIARAMAHEQALKAKLGR